MGIQGVVYAVIYHMKRTTIFIDEHLERELQALARREGRAVAALVREAVERYVVTARGSRPTPLRFLAAGRSGRQDIAERHEELLFQEDAVQPSGRRQEPARPDRAGRRRRAPRRSG